MDFSFNQILLIFLLYVKKLDTQMRRFLPLIENDSITYRHDLAVHVKAVLPSTRDPSLENPDYSFRLALLHSVTYLSFHYQLPSCSL